MRSRSDRKKMSPNTAQAQCDVCYETFATVDLFDSHRRFAGGCSQNFSQFCETMELFEQRQVWGTEEWHSKNEATINRLQAGRK